MRLIDLHCDTILRLMKDKDKLELKENKFCVDIEKLKKGKSLAQFFALYVELNPNNDPLEICLEMLDKLYEEVNKNCEDIAIARNYNDILSNDEARKISAIISIEEGGVFKGKIHNLRNFYRLGVRSVTLTWNFPNEIGYPNFSEEFRDKGLTAFGEEVVAEMNRLGMIIDVSHLSDKGFYDVAKLSSKPFIASHSNARTIRNHPRNLTDDMIKTLANKGGVTGINFEGMFLQDGKDSTVEHMIRHINHIRNIGGIDVISIGSDFDGTSELKDIKTTEDMYKLVEGLSGAGYSEEDIEKIMYKNALRVIKDTL